ncbi:hypothetical protein N9284_01360 [Halieaceae bacterium]|nr:hypothetical protein [Halieaceae bacterium]
MHDIMDLEGRGIPGGFIASSAFIAAAKAQGDALGFHPAKVFVPHPIQDRTDDEIRVLAENAVKDILAMISQSET